MTVHTLTTSNSEDLTERQRETLDVLMELVQGVRTGAVTDVMVFFERKDDECPLNTYTTYTDRVRTLGAIAMIQKGLLA